MQALGIKTEHFIIMCLLSGHAVFTLWYTARVKFEHECVYATTVINGGPVVWGSYNNSLIYVTFVNHSTFLDGLSGYDYSCRENLLSGDTMVKTAISTPLHDKIRIVLGTRNCHAYFWCVQLKMIFCAWFVYGMYLQFRRIRRMFGPFRSSCELISPTSYSLNYVTRVISNILLGYPYTKLARLLCDVSMRRDGMSKVFNADPISFLYMHKGVTLLMLLEVIAHISSGCIVLLTLGVAYTPCALLYPTYIRILAWVVVCTLAIVELISYVRPKPTKDNHLNHINTGGIRGICTTCCATVMSGLAIKCFYIVIFAIAVVIFMHYEQRVQVSLFGESENSQKH
uniref:Envelope glycoprotein K n=1 Tax=Human herpesvirus 3 TaxID=10335 RepID=A0A4D6F1U3_HHV3|nr:ORF5 [Human alphaherpesvirus 3]